MFIIIRLIVVVVAIVVIAAAAVVVVVIQSTMSIPSRREHRFFIKVNCCLYNMNTNGRNRNDVYNHSTTEDSLLCITVHARLY